MGKVSWQFRAEDYSKATVQQTSQRFTGGGGNGAGQRVAASALEKQQKTE